MHTCIVNVKGFKLKVNIIYMTGSIKLIQYVYLDNKLKILLSATYIRMIAYHGGVLRVYQYWDVTILSIHQTYKRRCTTIAECSYIAGYYALLFQYIGV